MDWEDGYDQYRIGRFARENRMRPIKALLEAIAWAVIIVVFCLASLTRAEGAEAVRIVPYPQAQLWRRDVQIRVSVFVEPDPKNHCIQLGWRFTYPGGGGNSSWELDERNYRQQVRYIKFITPGKVWIHATLHRVENGEDKHIRIETIATVLFPGMEDES